MREEFSWWEKTNFHLPGYSVDFLNCIFFDNISKSKQVSGLNYKGTSGIQKSDQQNISKNSGKLSLSYFLFVT